MWLKQTEAPELYPVSRAEAKAHLRVPASNTDSDTFIDALIIAATQHLEGRFGVLNRALITQAWEYRLDAFPCGLGSQARIELPLPPLQTVDAIKYLGTTGVLTTLSPSAYTVSAEHLVGRVRPAYGLTWPVALPEPESVRIEFTAGYGDAAAAVPMPLRQAMLLLIGHWWLNREAVGQAGGPHALAVEALTLPYRTLEA